MRRGQTEMIGLVFIVVALLLGLLVYVKFSVIVKNPAGDLVDRARDVQQTSSFLVALKETTVPNCGGAPMERLARACIENDRSFCITGRPCDMLQELFENLVKVTLVKQGIKFNLSLEGTEVMVVSTDVNGDLDCVSADRSVDISSAPVGEVVLSGGSGKGYIRLSMCR
ncbi:hypothetical protein GOV11_00130 [Candidatus Woesearchaeota archaeon]|nr:hypothetical protein [Candidatus Woesearchaeota archaeon]